MCSVTQVEAQSTLSHTKSQHLDTRLELKQLVAGKDPTACIML